TSRTASRSTARLTPYCSRRSTSEPSDSPAGQPRRAISASIRPATRVAGLSAGAWRAGASPAFRVPWTPTRSTAIAISGSHRSVPKAQFTQLTQWPAGNAQASRGWPYGDTMEAPRGGDPAQPEQRSGRRQHGQQQGQRQRGAEEVAKRVPVVGQRHHDGNYQPGQYLGGEERGQPGQAPAPVHEPVPHAVQE